MAGYLSVAGMLGGTPVVALLSDLFVGIDQGADGTKIGAVLLAWYGGERCASCYKQK